MSFFSVSNIGSQSFVMHDPDSLGPGRCIVCLKTKAEWLPLSCGHMTYCKMCIEALQECSICGKSIAGRVKMVQRDV